MSWFATQNWLDRGEVHRDGRVGTERFHLSPITWGVWEISEKLVYLAEHIWQKCSDENPIRLPRSINKYAPSSTWFWRRATCADSSVPVSEMAFVVFFIQYLTVAVNTAPHTSIFHAWFTCTRLAQVWHRTHSLYLMFHVIVVSVWLLSRRQLHSLLPDRRVLNMELQNVI